MSTQKSLGKQILATALKVNMYFLPPPHPSLSHTEVPRGRLPLKRGFQEQRLPQGTRGKAEITPSLWETGMCHTARRGCS